jgi:D-threonine aldolase
MPHPYKLDDEASVITPSMAFYPKLIEANINRVIEMVGDVNRLRPHVKTHKTREIVRLQLNAGVTKHKCATIAEAELLASCAAPDVLIAYPILRPNAERLGKLATRFSRTQFSAVVDSEESLQGLARAAERSPNPLGAYLDLDVGMHRTGMAITDKASVLYSQLAQTPRLIPRGLHAYDGQNHQESKAERLVACRDAIGPVLAFRTQLRAMGLPCETIVAGGTPNFPMYAEMTDIEGLECSPGTYVLHDHGYGSRYPDFTGITPAAVLVTRVISKPTPTRVTFDLGHKAVAADPVLAKRVQLLDAPPHTVVGHSEEHLVIETDHADQFEIGAVYYALPGHVCPTCALHHEAITVEAGKITGAWEIIARRRKITI